jgi:hypothetical protein
MPAFSVGDLIIVCVVLLILVIFRALDRNNRSIEKLKRFSDKITENLSLVVEDKTRQLKELSAAVSGELKAGREIMEKVRAMEQGLEGKSDTFDLLQKRLADYDKTLGELTTMSGRVDENIKLIRDQSGYVDGVGKRLKESAAQMEALNREIPALDEKLKAAGRQALKEIMARIAEMEKGLPALGEKLSGDGKKKLEAAVAEAAASLEGRTKGLRADLETSEKRVKDFSAYIVKLESRIASAEGERVAALKKTLDSFDVDLKGKRAAAMKDITTAAEGFIKDAESRIAAQRGEIAEGVRRAETLEGEVFSRLRESIQKDEESLSASVEKIEARFQDYETEIEYRFKKLEETGVDISAMEKSLRQSMEKASSDARESMKELSAKLGQEWKTEIAAVQAEKVKLAAGMSELAEGLSGLKSSAYQDVSEKLQVFEDEFFADLRVRTAAMQEKIQAWQAEVQARNAESDQAHAAHREKLEKAYQDEIRVALEKLKKSSVEEIARVESRVAEMESGAKERITAAEGSLAELREALRAELDRTRRDFTAGVERELATARLAAENSSKKLQRDVEQGLVELASGLEGAKKETAESLSAVQAGMTSWQTTLQKQMADTESSIMKKIAAAAFDAENAIGNIRDVFASEKEELVVGSNAERMAVKNDQLGPVGPHFRAQGGA